MDKTYSFNSINRKFNVGEVNIGEINRRDQ